MTTLFEIKNLTLALDEKNICRDLNLKIHPSEIIGVLGQNGGGKTTLLQTMAALRESADAEILLRGKKLSSFTRKECALEIGFLFQDSQDIFPQTVLDYCLTARYAHSGNWRLHDQEEDLNLARRALLEMDLHDLQTRKINSLSGGERRRLAIASLLTQAPTIYFLDEPTNHLDIRYQIYVLNYFKQLAKNNAAVVMSLHDVNLARQFCDRVLILLGEGEFILGEPSEICTRDNIARMLQCPIEWLPEFTAINNACKIK